MRVTEQCGENANKFCSARTPAHFMGSKIPIAADPGACAPGFMLAPAPQAKATFRAKPAQRKLLETRYRFAPLREIFSIEVFLHA
jgi:hypothetical protein